MTKQKINLKDINFFKDDDIYINSMEELYYNYENLKKYVLIITRKYNQVSFQHSYEDILHNVIIQIDDVFNKLRTGKYDRNDGVFKDENIHILYIKKIVKFQILVLLRNMKINTKHISNKEDIGEYGNSIFLTSLSDDNLDDRVTREIYITSLEDSLLELEDFERILINYSELISTKQISEITNLDYNELQKEIYKIRKKLKDSILNKVDSKVTLEKIKRIYEN